MTISLWKSGLVISNFLAFCIMNFRRKCSFQSDLLRSVKCRQSDPPKHTHTFYLITDHQNTLTIRVKSIQVPGIVQDILYLTAVCNSCANPVIYGMYFYKETHRRHQRDKDNNMRYVIKHFPQNDFVILKVSSMFSVTILFFADSHH